MHRVADRAAVEHLLTDGWDTPIGAVERPMRRVVVVQARMTSTRLPGKVLMDLAGRPLLERELERLRACRRVDEIVLATTTNADDDPLVALAEPARRALAPRQRARRARAATPARRARPAPTSSSA